MADELLELTELQRVLQEYAEEATEIYKYQISLGGKNASRKLIESVSSNVMAKGKNYEVTLKLQEYWKCIEGGRKGTESSPAGAVHAAAFPPVGALISWIQVKPVIPRPDSNGRLPSPKQLAYLIGRKIEEQGIEPYPALKTTQEELDKIYRDRIEQALVHDIGYYIRKVF